MPSQVEIRYKNAADSVTEKLKKDQNVLAVIVLGSLSYDKVWEKSDIDMTAVVRDDQKLEKHTEYCIDEDDIVVNIEIITRSSFISRMNKAVEGLLSHSMSSRGRFLFTRDDSLLEYLDISNKIGQSDMELAAFSISENIVGYMQKAEKWIRVKNDATYSRFYLLELSHHIARLEVCLNYKSPSREAILQAAELNPGLIDRFYYYPMNNVLSCDDILKLLKEADDYLMKHIDIISKPVVEYLSDGEPKTVTAMSRYFKFGGHALTHITEYFKEKGIIDKTTEMIRVTPKGRPVVEEIAYVLEE